ncbi:MAG: sulfur carrier protein ThiS [Gammaproteobacteria bacterium]|nr:sulfur carrier protein ThiS [Gammaproteobacteria bacterium]
MVVYVNAEPHALDKPMTITELLDQLQIKPGRIAVAVNRQVVPRSEYSSQLVQADDQIDIVQAVGGG